MGIYNDRVYDLRNNAYISFSGGKDSTILHYLIDMALPNNNIPRLFLNTGIEYIYIYNHVKELAEHDKRIIILNSGVNIKQMLEKEGYPFKSKQHSHNLDIYWHNKTKDDYTLSLKRYLGIIESTTKFHCPQMLRYQFEKDFNLHCSDKCCYNLKKKPAKQWAYDNNKTIVLTGMRKDEGGQRASIGCIVTDKDGKLTKFHPLLVVSDKWENDFVENNNIKLCSLYYPPYNFKRTGCRCCPFGLDLQNELDALYIHLPQEYKASVNLWKPVFDEYKRIGFRIKEYPHIKGVQLSIFDLEEKK